MCNIKRLFLDSQLSVYSPISNFLFSIYQVFQEAISRYLREHGYDNIRLKAVLFDMDGVLFNSMPYHADAWHTVMERHGLHLSREEAICTKDVREQQQSTSYINGNTAKMPLLR